jgi:ABC-type multidrug transport system fused ATPase/permease subunit
MVMEGLDRLMMGRTVVTITHRLNTIRDADKIIVLHGGIVAEQGTHTELLAVGGIYAGFYRAKIVPTTARGPRHIPPAAEAVCPAV